MVRIGRVGEARPAGAAATIVSVVAALCVFFNASPAAAAPPAYIQIPCSPFGAGNAAGAAGVAYSPNGALLATANSTGASLSVFAVGAGGQSDHRPELAVRGRIHSPRSGVQPGRRP